MVSIGGVRPLTSVLMGTTATLPDRPSKTVVVESGGIKYLSNEDLELAGFVRNHPRSVDSSTKTFWVDVEMQIGVYENPGSGFCEDNHCYYFFPKSEEGAVSKTAGFVAVFDGHGSFQCSKHCAAKLKEKLLASARTIQGEPLKLLNNIFFDLERSLYEDVRVGPISHKAGTTATVVLLGTDGFISVAFVGDSEAILVRNDGTVVDLTRKNLIHNRRNPFERERGNWVPTWVGREQQFRLNGSLNISRALGDFKLKTDMLYVDPEDASDLRDDAFTESAYPESGVLAKPYVNRYKVDGSESFLVVGSDGLFDKLSHGEIAKYIADISKRSVALEKKEVRSICEGLCKLARDKGTTDDITVAILPLS